MEKTFNLETELTINSVSTTLKAMLRPLVRAFKYYVIKEVGGWGQKMVIFDDLQIFCATF